MELEDFSSSDSKNATAKPNTEDQSNTKNSLFGTWSPHSRGKSGKKNSAKVLFSISDMFSEGSGGNEMEEHVINVLPVVVVETAPSFSINRSRSDLEINEQEEPPKTNGTPNPLLATMTRAKKGIYDFWRKIEKVMEHKPPPESPPPSPAPVRSSKRLSSSTSAKRKSPLPSSGSVAKVIFAEGKDWKQITKENWKKTLQKQSVVKDLPRLANCIKVDISQTKSNEFIQKIKTREEMNPTKSPASRRRSTRSQLFGNVSQQILFNLLQISFLIEDRDTLSQLFDSYEKIVTAQSDESGQLAGQLGQFFRMIGEDCKLVKILKTCHQGTIAPIIIEMRLKILSGFPFRDSPGWKIRISSDPLTKIVSVSHTKRQCQQSHNRPEEEFEFEWELKIEFNPQIEEIINVSFKVNELKFGKDCSAELKEKLTLCLKDYRPEVLPSKRSGSGIYSCTLETSSNHSDSPQQREEEIIVPFINLNTSAQ